MIGKTNSSTGKPVEYFMKDGNCINGAYSNNAFHNGARLQISQGKDQLTITLPKKCNVICDFGYHSFDTYALYISANGPSPTVHPLAYKWGGQDAKSVESNHVKVAFEDCTQITLGTGLGSSAVSYYWFNYIMTFEK